MVPNVVPALLTITVFSVVWYYNDYTLSGMLLNDNFPLSVTLTGVSTSLNNRLQNMAGRSTAPMSSCSATASCRPPA